MWSAIHAAMDITGLLVCIGILIRMVNGPDSFCDCSCECCDED